jgi:hypothetical protein
MSRKGAQTQTVPSLVEFAKQRRAAFVRCPLCKAAPEIRKQVVAAMRGATMPRAAVLEWLKAVGVPTSSTGLGNHVEHHEPLA